MVYNVTENLRCALGYLRLPDRKRTFWIDALCINQADSQERSHEVRRMRDIFAKANRLTIWLGDYDNLLRLNVDECFRYLESYIGQGERPEGIPFELHMAFRFYEILSRPWFRRIWVIQEVAVRQRRCEADSIQVMCGASITQFAALTASFNAVTACGDFRNSQSSRIRALFDFSDPISSIERIAQRFWDIKEGRAVTTPAQTLLQYLHLTSKFFASDGRDNLYALLGLLPYHTNASLPDDI